MNHYANAREAQRIEAWARYDAFTALAQGCHAMKAWAATVEEGRRRDNVDALIRQAFGILNSISAMQIASRLPRPVGQP
jgi:hypothetical protein